MSNKFGALLKTKLEEIQKKNPRFSFRSLAKKVGISPGCLNELMHGKRPLSEFYANKIVLGLELGSEERNEVYSLISTRSRKFAAQKVLMEKEMEMLSSWEHYAILNMIRMKTFQAEPEWIADRLALPVDRVQRSLDLLMDLGFIKRKGNSIARAVASLATTEDIPSQALVKAHLSDMSKAVADKELCQSQIATVSRGLASVQQNSEVRMQQLEKENQDLKQRLERLEQALLKGK
ncbi:DUF4423 domain-containing protein [Bdellovibrio bacteriovorus]|uniref:DUF4423 domain-containing protein n=1 Tax=Bdellovibrio bacteriovorus TaxID=959 RepID=UPI0021D2BCD8|nr:DUF4423 domain-containing protein [Bdellovibrio bacteriovorus]UXR66238.1 DUF4423 domain-containing protein [Bdellovibrio bacteriovorus]